MVIECNYKKHSTNTKTGIKKREKWNPEQMRGIEKSSKVIDLNLTMFRVTLKAIHINTPV